MRAINAWQWAVLAVLAANTVANIAYIGKERKPITPGSAVAVLIVNALIAWAVVMA